MTTLKRYCGLAVVALGLAVAAFAAGATTVVVTVSGTSYALTAAPLSFTANGALLQAQPWWGNEPLAFAISTQLKYQLGDLNGGPGTALGIPSALMAYGIGGPDVSITYWDGTTVQNCPTGCPPQGTTFFYVTGAALSNKIPTLSEWALVILATLTGLIGLFATRQVLRRA